MVEPRPAETRDEEDSWFVHINEGFGVTVKAPSVELALMKAFAKYWEQHENPETLAFDIQVTNMTLYKKVVREDDNDGKNTAD